mgnify:CR=1 FL=1
MALFNKVDFVRAWCYKVLPLVYDDSLSYYEVLCKMKAALNEVIENVNNLPEYIADLIEQFITSGAIDEVVREILANYILNVKYPPKGITPAVGDGSADDTAAIQGCIDYAAANGYGAVYFPYGKYLSSPITLKSNVGLYGFDRYSTSIICKGGASAPLFSGTVENVSIANLTLDGNDGFQVNDIDLINVTAANMLLTNLIFTDASRHIIINGNGGHLQIDNLVFNACVINALTISGNVDVQAKAMIFNEVSAVRGKCAIQIESSGGVYDFISKASVPVGMIMTGSNNTVNASIDNAVTPYNDTGAGNNIVINGKSVKQTVSGDVTQNTGGNVTKTFGGNVTKTFGGIYSITIAQKMVEQITGDRETIVGGNVTEAITGNKGETITGGKTETISGDKKTTASNLNETYAGDKTTTATDFSITAKGHYTEDIATDYTRDVGGNDIEIITGTRNISVKNDSTEAVAGKKEIVSEDLLLKPTNPLSYRKPSELNTWFSSIPFKDYDGNQYNVLVDNGVVTLKNTPHNLVLPTKQTGRMFNKNTGVTTPDYDWLQGFEVDTDGTIYAAFINNVNYPNNAKICKIVNYEIVSSVIVDGIGHCNGVTVDENYIYIASYSTTAGTNNLIYKLNKSNLTVLNNKPVDTVPLVYSIAYDKVNKNFWCGGNGNYYNITENAGNWTVNKTISKTVPSGITQSFCVNNDVFYEVKTIPNILFTFGIDTNPELYYIPNWIEDLFWTGEVEDISFNNDNLQIGSISHLTQYSEINIIRWFETSFVNNIEQRSISYDPSYNVYTLNVNAASTLVNPTGIGTDTLRYIGEAVSMAGSPGFSNRKIRINVSSGDYEAVTISRDDVLIIGNNYRTQLFITYASNVMIRGAILTPLTLKQSNNLINIDHADVTLVNCGFEVTEGLQQYVNVLNSKLSMPSLNTNSPLLNVNSESAQGIFIRLNASKFFSVRYFKRILTVTASTDNIMYVQDSDINLDTNKAIPLFAMIGDGINLSDYFSCYDTLVFIVDNVRYPFKAVNNGTFTVVVNRIINNVLSTVSITFVINGNNVNVTNIAKTGTSFTPVLNEIYFTD